MYDIRDADFDFSMVENLYTFGPEYNGTQVALWHSTTTWNSTTDITSRGQGSPGISFVRNGDLIHRGIEQNGTSYMVPYAVFTYHHNYLESKPTMIVCLCLSYLLAQLMESTANLVHIFLENTITQEIYLLQFYIWARLQVMTFYLHKILQ